MRPSWLLLAGVSLSGPALAQAPAASPTPAAPAAPAETEESTDGVAEEADIVVTGGRIQGAVLGDIPPETTLRAGDIRSFGVNSIADLVTELAPQTGSGQGRGGEAPIVLLNGKRISSFAEIRDVPTEAIQRVEILPEEVALKYGYRPNQKVVNIVLRRRFRAFTGEVEAAAATEGGRFSPEIEGTHFAIREGTRTNVALEYSRDGALYESERDLIGRTSGLPYAPAGNITSAVTGAPVDPALSALLGRPATVVGVPASAATAAPPLAAFVPGTVNADDQRRFRTLLPQNDQVTLNAVLARPLGDVSASLNGTLTYAETKSAQGLASAIFDLPPANPFSPFAGDTILYRSLDEFGALGQRNRSLTAHLGATLNGALGTWNWTVTGNLDRATSRTRTERGYDLTGAQGRIDALDAGFNPFAPLDAGTSLLVDRARSRSTTGDVEGLLTGTPFTLPAGAATATLRLGGAFNDFASRTDIRGLVTSADLSRRSANGQATLDLPIASRRNRVLSAIGDLSVNINAGHERLSDFGGLTTLGAGLNWKPFPIVTLIASWNKEEGAPTVQQLGNPVIATEGVRVFDFVRGETVDITRIAGGNPNLRSDDRRVLKLGATLKPLAGQDLSIVANYTDSRIRNPIAAFPTATAALEAAFPQRFLRDASGRLLLIDARTINFARSDSEQFRWGVNFSKQLSTPPRPAGGPGGQAREGQSPDLRAALPPEAGRPRPSGDAPPPPPPSGEGRPPRGPGGFRGPGGPGGFGGPGGGFGRGTRMQVAIYHTVRLRETIRVFEGGPQLDLLNGDAIASSGGQSRHEVQAQGGITHNGIGLRGSVNWRSATRVNGATAADSLRFSDITTANLRLFANLGAQRALVERWPWLRGSRVTFGVNNLFNQRLRVTDAAGTTPIGYQPAYLDPLGRTISIEFRKLFF